eukprot:5717246-Alexandrium_andersonii.AAC.1
MTGAPARPSPRARAPGGCRSSRRRASPAPSPWRAPSASWRRRTCRWAGPACPRSRSPAPPRTPAARGR